jgi:hypothetical protein
MLNAATLNNCFCIVINLKRTERKWVVNGERKKTPAIEADYASAYRNISDRGKIQQYIAGLKGALYKPAGNQQPLKANGRRGWHQLVSAYKPWV